MLLPGNHNVSNVIDPMLSAMMYFFTTGLTAIEPADCGHSLWDCEPRFLLFLKLVLGSAPSW